LQKGLKEAKLATLAIDFDLLPLIYGIVKGTIVSEKPQPQGIISMTRSLIFFFNFKYCESVGLYIILLEVACELSCFCKMARRSKVGGPHCYRRTVVI